MAASDISGSGPAVGAATTVQDIYAELRETISSDSRWSRLLSQVFNQEFVPSNVPRADIVAEFARDNGFHLCDMTTRLTKVQSMSDLVKFYSTCTKLALAQPKTLYFIVPDVDASHSLCVLEGLHALRASLLAGSFSIFFRDRTNATTAQMKVMRTRKYDLCLWQADNIVLLSNCTEHEMRRKLNDLVAECSICLEYLTDMVNGSVVYPFRCEHAFHSRCVQTCAECPECRNKWKPGRTVFKLIDRIAAVKC